MYSEFLQQLIVAMTGMQIDLSREILEVARQNLRMNTLALEQAVHRNEIEKDLIDSIHELISVMKA